MSMGLKRGRERQRDRVRGLKSRGEMQMGSVCKRDLRSDIVAFLRAGLGLVEIGEAGWGGITSILTGERGGDGGLTSTLILEGLTSTLMLEGGPMPYSPY